MKRRDLIAMLAGAVASRWHPAGIGPSAI